MNEHHRLLRRQGAPADVGHKPGQRLAGVDRVGEDPLLAREQAQGLQPLRRGDAVALADEGVVVVEVGRGQGHVQVQPFRGLVRHLCHALFVAVFG